MPASRGWSLASLVAILAAMRLAPSVVLATLLVAAACGGATTPQEPVVEPYEGDDGGGRESGVMQPECIAGETACDGMCTDTQSDSKHCGTCGNVCGKGTYCSEGVCTPGDGGGGGGFPFGDAGGHHD